MSAQSVMAILHAVVELLQSGLKCTLLLTGTSGKTTPVNDESNMVIYLE